MISFVQVSLLPKTNTSKWKERYILSTSTSVQRQGNNFYQLHFLYILKETYLEIFVICKIIRTLFYQKFSSRDTLIFIFLCLITMPNFAIYSLCVLYCQFFLIVWKNIIEYFYASSLIDFFCFQAIATFNINIKIKLLASFQISSNVDIIFSFCTKIWQQVIFKPHVVIS